MIRVTREIKRVIDVYATVKGYMCVGSYCRPNRLLRNFYLLLWGILTNTRQEMRNVMGDWRRVYISEGPACKPAHVWVCKENYDVGFNAHECTRITGSDVAGVAVEDNCATWAIVADKGGNSVATFFRLPYYEHGTRQCVGFMVAHDVVHVSEGQTVKHKICFNSPWTQGAAALMAAIACHCNDITATSITGQTFKLRGAGKLVAGPADIVLVTDAGNLVPAMYRYARITDTYAYINITGVLATTEAIRPSRAALCAKVYDSGGATHLLPLVNLGAMPLEPNKVYSISVHIFGG